MSKYCVRIIFDGLVAVGPPPPAKGSTVPGPLFAIMPFASRRLSRWKKLGLKSGLNQPEDPTYTSVHFPVIATKTNPDECESRPPDEYTNGWYVWYPMRERMQLSFDDGGPGNLTYGGTPITECKKVEAKRVPGEARRINEVDIHAVSNMREIWPGRATVRGKMFRRKAPHEVAAQVFVPRGYVVGGTDDDLYPYGVHVAYRPKRTNDEVCKCAVQQVIVKVEDVKKVDFAMYSLETGDRLDGISFNLTANADIRVMNADPRAIRKLLAGTELVEGVDYFGPDVDFENVYSILRGWGSRYLPVPVVIDGPFMLRPCYTALVEGD